MPIKKTTLSDVKKTKKRIRNNGENVHGGDRLMDPLNLLRNNVVELSDSVEESNSIPTNCGIKVNSTVNIISNNPFVWIVAIVILILALCRYGEFVSLAKSSLNAKNGESLIKNRGWNNIMQGGNQSDISPCDIVIFENELLNKMLQNSGNAKSDDRLLSTPFLIRGSPMKSWPAYYKWEKKYFIDKFGNDSILVRY